MQAWHRGRGARRRLPGHRPSPHDIARRDAESWFLDAQFGRPIADGAEVADAGLIRQLVGALALKAVVGEAQRRKQKRAEAFRTTLMSSRLDEYAGPLSYARAKPVDTLSFHTLRSIAKHSLVNSAIHAMRARSARSASRKWNGQRGSTGWAVVHHRHHDEDFDASKVDGLDARIKRIEELLERPHPTEPDFAGMLVKLLEQHLTFDRTCINLLFPTLNRGVPVGMAWVDGATIWPAHLWLRQYVTTQDKNLTQEGLDRHREALCRQQGVDFDRVRWVQVDPDLGIEAASFLGEDDLVVGISRPSDDWNHHGFGISAAESSWVAASLSLRGYTYASGFFTHALSEVAAVLSGNGSDYNDEDVEVFKQVLRSHYSGDGKHFKVPFLETKNQGDLQFVPTRQNSAVDMAFPEIQDTCTKLICTHYGADPSEINIDARGPGRGTLSEPSRDDEKRIKRDVGFMGNLEFIADQMNRVIERIDPDLRFVWMGLDDDTEDHELDLRTRRVEGGWISLNEARLEEGRKPRDEPWFDVPKQLAGQAFSQATQAEQPEDAAQEGPEGEPGPEQGDGEASGGEGQTTHDSEAEPGDGDDRGADDPLAFEREPAQTEATKAASAFIDIFIDEV